MSEGIQSEVFEYSHLRRRPWVVSIAEGHQMKEENLTKETGKKLPNGLGGKQRKSHSQKSISTDSVHVVKTSEQHFHTLVQEPSE